MICMHMIYYNVSYLQEAEYGKFYLECNDNIRIVNPPATSNILITPVNYQLLS